MSTRSGVCQEFVMAEGRVFKRLTHCITAAVNEGINGPVTWYILPLTALLLHRLYLCSGLTPAAQGLVLQSRQSYNIAVSCVLQSVQPKNLYTTAIHYCIVGKTYTNMVINNCWFVCLLGRLFVCLFIVKNAASPPLTGQSVEVLLLAGVDLQALLVQDLLDGVEQTEHLDQVTQHGHLCTNTKQTHTFI